LVSKEKFAHLIEGTSVSLFRGKTCFDLFLRYWSR